MTYAAVRGARWAKGKRYEGRRGEMRQAVGWLVVDSTALPASQVQSSPVQPTLARKGWLGGPLPFPPPRQRLIAGLVRRDEVDR